MAISVEPFHIHQMCIRLNAEEKTARITRDSCTPKWLKSEMGKNEEARTPKPARFRTFAVAVVDTPAVQTVAGNNTE
ncbi:hypothetical protein AB0323_06640 [Arthrobacter sp. NPDC080031]|uniref:hypothetical protein n=1 Tax=Arthrobacter sp. NPDC080031 TaxID=3155918 RepID=UPI00344D20B7